MRRLLQGTAWQSLAAVALALGVGLAAIALSGRDPVAALEALVAGGLGGVGPIGESADKAAILALTSLAVALPFAVGLFNIGGQGQLLAGAVAAAWLGRALDLPAPLEIPAVLLGAALVGGLFALVAGWLKTARGVHEVISTIMLNWVAMHLIENWLVIGPLRARSAGAQISLPGTALIRDQAQLPVLLAGSRLHAGVAIAAAAVLLGWLLLARTRLGFELRAVGASPEAARYAGISVGRRICEAMLLGGACAGLAGALLVLGTEFRYPPHLASSYGFDGIALSFIGANHPLGAAAASIFFGAIRAGGTRLQLLQIHRDFPELIQGLTLLFVAGRALLAAGAARLARTRAAAPAAEVERA